MGSIGCSWTDLKNFATTRNVSIQFLELESEYRLHTFDGPFSLSCILSKDESDDLTDFETNFKANCNKSLLPTITSVTTQFEKTNKVLKLSSATSIVDSNGEAIISIKIPGSFGSGKGRYVLGGYGISADYNFGDKVTCHVEDKDRNIAMMIALAMNPSATAPIPDVMVQQIGVIPGVGQAFPNYPIVQSYTDDEMPTENQGWYFWPLTNGTSTPVGEVEINPIGGYGYIPSGLYLIIVYKRPPGITTGAININIDWGREE